jgi:hypothetical protein
VGDDLGGWESAFKTHIYESHSPPYMGVVFVDSRIKVVS